MSPRPPKSQAKPAPKKRGQEPPAKRGVGRPPSVTVEQEKLLCDYLALGVPRVDALTLSEIPATTYGRWMRAGEAIDDAAREAVDEGRRPAKLTVLQERQRTFWRSVTRAKVRSIPSLLRIVVEGAAGGAEFTQVTRVVDHVRNEESGVVEAVVREERRKTVTLAPDPRLALDLLSRLRPSEFARTERRELTGRDGGPVEQRVNVAQAALEDPELMAAVDRLLDMEGAVADGGEA